MKPIKRIPAGKIGQEQYRQMLKGKHGDIYRAVKKELEEMGETKSLYQSSVPRARFVKVAKQLQAKRLIPKTATAFRLAQRAETKQRQGFKTRLAKEKKSPNKAALVQQAKAERIRKRRIQAHLKQDIAKGQLELEQNRNPYPQGSFLYQEFERERQEFEPGQNTRRQNLRQAPAPVPPEKGKKVELPDIENLPDLDIG